MSFSEGQTIVHPFHGPLLVLRIADRTVQGVTRAYLDLRALRHPLDISVPVEQAEATGLRAIASEDRVEALLAIRGAPRDEEPLGWARRLKDYQGRVATGEVEQVCYVIREISRRNPKSPASAESGLLRTARATLQIEFALALQITSDEAGALITAAVQPPASEIAADV
jgi:CarD family transcriptional regulator